MLTTINWNIGDAHTSLFILSTNYLTGGHHLVYLIVFRKEGN